MRLLGWSIEVRFRLGVNVRIEGSEVSEIALLRSKKDDSELIGRGGQAGSDLLSKVPR